MPSTILEYFVGDFCFCLLFYIPKKKKKTKTGYFTAKRGDVKYEAFYDKGLDPFSEKSGER